MKINDFIIDFDRVKELSSTKNDSNEGYNGTYHFAISRKLIKEYLDILFGDSKYRKNDDMMEHIINTLIYNRRKDRIEEILEDE
jgi:hypothetical protein